MAERGLQPRLGSRGFPFPGSHVPPAASGGNRCDGGGGSVKILVVGGAGKAGRAICLLMQERGHGVVTVGRRSGEVRCDISDEEQLARMWQEVGRSRPSSAPRPARSLPGGSTRSALRCSPKA
ncbi:NAD-dependent epimerase/dehydratase family protein [Arthrobacter ginkgonis]|uniref:NAD-dependent epimerase/dehydratase family protein n=1 Tax=Arthrobacter ginkgonis TaxID=1630594 RepID=UPI003CD05BE5